MPDSVDSLHGQILELAITYADCKAEEEARNQRNINQLQKESTVVPRITAADALQKIRLLVWELRKKEGT